MSSSLYSDNSNFEEIVVPCEIVPTEKHELFQKYEIERCVRWIKENNYREVSLQFPDELLIDSTDVIFAMEDQLNQKLYILADCTYGGCCVDYIAAEHVNSDAIIHFGKACLSSVEVIPTLYIFPKEYLDIPVFVDSLINLIDQNNRKVVLLYDVSFSYCMDDIRKSLGKNLQNVIISQLLTSDIKKNCLSTILESESSSHKVIRKLSRRYSIPVSSNSTDFLYVYLVSKYGRKNLENFVVSSPELQFYSYCNNQLIKETIPRTIRRKLYEIEKVKCARRIGILITSLNIDLLSDAIARIKNLCKIWKKKSYIITTSKLNVAKLANFPEIDVFVVLCCPEMEINNKKEYFQPIVTMMEIELALNKNQQWEEKVVPDFREFLIGGTEHKEINKNISSSDVSLLTNKLLLNDISDDCVNNSVAVKDPMTVDLCDIKSGLSGRSWKGLELDIGKTPIEKATMGLSGTPSTGYVHPSTNNLV